MAEVRKLLAKTMAINRNHKILLPLLLLLGGLVVISGCNSKSEDDPTTVTYPSMAINVTSFSLKADTKVLTGLEKVFFSIDLNKGVVFNADSLPKGTRVTDLVPVINYGSMVSKAVITMEGGKKRQGEVDYMKSPSDSIDFTGRVTLRLSSAEGNEMVYELKVNVHQIEPDSLWWSKTSMSRLPSSLPAPIDQRTLMFGEKVLTLSHEVDGSYTLASSLEPASGNWDKKTPRFGFTPQVRTLTATSDRLYILADDGSLYSSADGLDWQSAGEKWNAIVGGYSSTLLGLKTIDGEMWHACYPAGSVATSKIPNGFPVKEFTNFHCMTSPWASSPVGIFAGGVDAAGEISSRVWAYDGSSWVVLSEDALPALRGATLIPYFAYRNPGTASWDFKEYSVLMVTGGIDANGTFNRALYISYDNGVRWAKGSEYMQMPDDIPGMWNMDNVVAVTEKSANIEPKGWTSITDKKLPQWYKVNYKLDGYDITWDCPFIYLFGGQTENGELYDTIWRGVINRLTFAPLI